jgi:radical SAM superfamily enzyme YgiQ (UPF0313 family)
MKVQLFYPKSTLGTYVNNGAYFSLTLLSIASYIKSKNPDIDVEIWDGELYESNDDLIKKLDKSSDVVGISSTTNNYSNVLDLAKKAKELGLYVVLGGVHPTYYKRTILENRPYIDGIFVGKGEYAFQQFLTESKKNNIPNFIWRDGKEIRENPDSRSLWLDELPNLDYSLLELDKYFQNHKKAYPHLPDKPLSTMTHEGCAKRDKYGPCTFCALQAHFTFRNPNIFWRQTEQAVDKYGFNIVRDWGDSLSEDKEFLKSVVNSRPHSLDNLIFNIYGNLASLDEERIELLKRLNVKMFFASVESGSDKMLRVMNKQATIKQMIHGLNLISKNGISILASYVLGERGEDLESLEKTYKVAREVREMADVMAINANPINLVPGSIDFELLIKKLPELKNQDLFDVKELRRLWVKNFCPKLLGPEVLDEYVVKMGGFGDIATKSDWDKTIYAR